MNGSGRIAALMTVFVIGWSAVAPAQPAQPATDAALRDALELLHAGRFDEADEAVGALSAAHPDEPAFAFEHAFVTWWRLLYDDESAPLTATFEARIVHAADVGAAALSRRDRPEDLIWAGYARLLCAQLRASQKKSLAAAREAREAHRRLTEAAKRMPSSSEALFGLGTYNYYADRVSALVKGLRFLLGLPAGDRDKGLDQLERAASGGGFFALESRLLRATLFAGKRERDYAAALVETGRALEPAPDAVTALDAASRLDLVLGREDLAAARLDRGLRLALDAPRTDGSVRSAMQLERARVEFARLRPDLSLEQLARLRKGPHRLPARVDRDATRLSALSKWLTGATHPGEPPPAAGAPPRPEVWKRLVRALELEGSQGAEASIHDLRAVAGEFPADASAKLLLGRALLRSGNAKAALATLTASDLSGALPEPWVGPYRLLCAQATDLAGDRARARELYLKAGKSPPFIEFPATVLRDKAPYTGAQ